MRLLEAEEEAVVDEEVLTATALSKEQEAIDHAHERVAAVYDEQDNTCVQCFMTV